MELPSDNYILLSLINTKLRDCYPTLAELCASECLDASSLTARLQSIGYEYDEGANCFEPV